MMKHHTNKHQLKYELFFCRVLFSLPYWMSFPLYLHPTWWCIFWSNANRKRQWPLVLAWKSISNGIIYREWNAMNCWLWTHEIKAWHWTYIISHNVLVLVANLLMFPKFGRCLTLVSHKIYRAHSKFATLNVSYFTIYSYIYYTFLWEHQYLPFD